MVDFLNISVVLGSYNRLSFFKKTIDTVRKELSSVYLSEIIVVDGGSTDGSIEWLVRQKDIIAIIQHNHGEWNGRKISKQNWGYYMNLGFKLCRYDYILMVSDDCLLIKDSLINALNQINTLKRNNTPFGGIAFQWRHWPDWEKYGVAYFYNKVHLNHGIYLKEALAKVGYADEITYSFYAADVDLSFKLHNAGLPILKAENSYLEHFNHSNSKYKQENIQKRESDESNLIDKWSKVWGSEYFENNVRWRRETVDFTDPDKTYEIFASIQSGLEPNNQ